jgi:hypothetical protein
MDHRIQTGDPTAATGLDRVLDRIEHQGRHHGGRAAPAQNHLRYASITNAT